MPNPIDHPHSQGLILTDEEWEDLAETEEVIDQSLAYGSPEPAIKYAYKLRRAGMLKGVKLAKILYELGEVWDAFEMDDRIEDYVQREMGVPIETYTKYTQAYKYGIQGAPKKHRRMMTGKPIGGLILLIAGSRLGQFTKENWEELASAHDKASMREVVREVRGIQAGGHAALIIQWEADGRVRARIGKGALEDIFVMPRNPSSKVAQAVVERTAEAAGYIRR